LVADLVEVVLHLCQLFVYIDVWVYPEIGSQLVEVDCLAHTGLLVVAGVIYDLLVLANLGLLAQDLVLDELHVYLLDIHQL